MIAESARRVLGRMHVALNDFQPGADVGPLAWLVGDLSGAIDTLVGDVDPDWVEELRSAWWALEYVNAIVLSDDRSSLTDSEQAAVAVARDVFLDLLREY